MKKRLLSGIICLCLLLAMFPAMASAASAEDNNEVIASGYCGDNSEGNGTNVTWSLTRNGTLTIAGEGDMGLRTTKDGGGTIIMAKDVPWYDYLDAVKKVYIGYGVTSICTFAFMDCVNLTDVTIPNSVTSINRSAFANCVSLAKIVIPQSVTSLGMQVFKDCKKLKTAGPVGGNYNIQFGWTNIIPRCAFYNSSITSIVLPDSITAIEDCVFTNCAELANVTFSNSLTVIGERSFEKCSSITKINIPNSVTTIESGAFGDCKNLARVYIPDSVTVCNSAFRGCEKLKTAGPADGNYDIRFEWSDKIPGDAFSGVFSGNAITSITFPDGLTSIGDHVAYKSANLTEVYIPASVTHIGQYAFWECDSLTDIYYGGTTSQWKNIEFARHNAPIEGANVHYSSEFTPLESDTVIDIEPEVEPVAPAVSFTDVTTADWFYSYVADMTKAGVVSGYPDGSFRPQGNVTWGEALKLVLKATGYGEFEAGTHWASGYMTKALAEGFMDHEVDLNSAITRGEMADLTAKAMKLAPSASPNPFDDEVSDYAVALYEAEIITGSQDNGRLVYRADSTITRAEMAAIIWRVYNK